MNKETEYYLERELAFISGRRDPLARYFAQHYPAQAAYASAFAERYPEPAGQMEFDPKQIPDPHTERLIQGFALLAGRIHRKIHDEFPNLTEALLQVLYPHLLRPIPSMSIAKFTPDWSAEDGAAEVHIPAGSELASRPVSHPPTPCQWRTGYDVNLWPIRVAEANFQPSALVRGIEFPPRTSAVLQLQLEWEGPWQFQQLGLDRLRFYLDGPLPLMSVLYELLFNHATQVLFRDPDRPGQITLRPEDALGQVGFELDEGLIPFPCESFVGYRLLTELFTFPNKFLFFDLKGLQAACQAGFGKRLQVLVTFDHPAEELVRALNARMFQLGCTPVINLFEKIADPLALTHTRFQYRVVADRACPNGVEVYSVDSVSTFDPDRARITDYQPFFSFRLGEDRNNVRAFWYPSRRSASGRGDRGTEVSLVLVDRDFNPKRPAEESMNIHTTCLNRDLPARLLRAGSELLLPAGASFAGSVQLIHAPTFPRRPSLRWGTLWRFLSQSALNRVPFSDAEEGIEALKETLVLCAGGELDAGQRQQAAVLRQMIEGITALESRRAHRPVFQDRRVGTCQGIEFTLELDRQKYIGVGAFLFACVVERFLGLYAAVNSFSQLQVRTRQGKGILKRWPPRAADLLVK